MMLLLLLAWTMRILQLVDRINCSISLFRSSVYVDIVLYFAILLPANGVVDLLKEILVFYFIVYLSF